jgi:capping protein beta
MAGSSRELIRYFEGGASSVYLWELEDGGFAGVVLLKKSEYRDDLIAVSKTNPGAKATSSELPTGTWDSIHVIEVAERGRQAHYKLTSTVLLNLVDKTKKSKVMNLSGSLTRQVIA